MIYWFTGQPGSGKTTLAEALAYEVDAELADSEELRQLFPEGYDEPSRRRNVERTQIIAAWLDKHVSDVCVAVIAPYRDQRETFKKAHNVTEIYLHTNEKRGREANFAEGYEPPLENFIDLDTGRLSIEECLEIITDRAAS